MKTAPLWLLLALGGAAHAEQEMSARSLARERFPSGLKIDRFSTTWPSGASIMADFLEGATAREILRERSSSSSSTMSAEDRAQLEESTKLLDLLPDLPQSRSSFPTRVEASGIGGAAATGGLIGLAALGAGLGAVSMGGGGLGGRKMVKRSIPKATKAPEGTATIPEHTFNLVKAIVGVGVLSLPAGITAFGDNRMAVLPAVFLITLMGALSGVGFSWIGQVCHYTGARSYAEAWAKTVGPGTAFLPAWSTSSKTFIACLAFSMVLADSLNGLVPIGDRTTILWTVTAFVLLPLCWLKNLKSLAPFSLLGVLGMVYTALAMTFRLARGSYLGGSPLLADLPVKVRPDFGNKGFMSVFSPQSVILVSMLSTAYMAHFSAPKYQVELKDTTIPRFNKVVALGFGISILLTAWIAAVGFSTFGGACSGLVLNNYSSKDVPMSLSRFAVALALVFSYPLAFQGCRDGFLDLSGMKNPSNAKLNVTTVLLLLALTSLATILKDVSFVLAFGGATLGNALCYVYPALMYMKVRPDRKVPAMALAGSGIILGVIGATLALQKL